MKNETTKATKTDLRRVVMDLYGKALTKGRKWRFIHNNKVYGCTCAKYNPARPGNYNPDFKRRAIWDPAIQITLNVLIDGDGDYVEHQENKH